MGGSQSAPPQTFEPTNWEPFQQIADNCILFHHVLAPDLHVECYNATYPIASSAQHDKVYQLRNSHPALVGAMFREAIAVKRNEYWGRLFIERIPVRLSMFRDVPYPDALHIYSQALKGFQVLATQIRTFAVTENLICLAQDSSIKVWMNEDLSDCEPAGCSITEAEMVKSILEAIEDNTDCRSLRGNIKPFLPYCCKIGLSFESAIQSLQSYAKEYFSGVIPNRLENIQKSGGAKELFSLWKLRQSKRLISEGPAQAIIFNSTQQMHHNPFSGQISSSKELNQSSKRDLLMTQASDTAFSPIKMHQGQPKIIQPYPPQIPAPLQLQYIPAENVQQPQIRQFYRTPSRRLDPPQMVSSQGVIPQSVIYHRGLHASQLLVPYRPMVAGQSSLVPMSPSSPHVLPPHIQQLLRKKQNKPDRLNNSFRFSSSPAPFQGPPHREAQIKVIFNHQARIPHRAPVQMEKKVEPIRRSLPMSKLKLLESTNKLESIKEDEEQEEMLSICKAKSKEEEDQTQEISNQNQNVSNGKKGEPLLLEEMKRIRQNFEKRWTISKLQNI